MLTQLYIGRSGDGKMINEHREQLRTLSNEEIIKAGESARKVGIVGVHAQGLYLAALWHEMNYRSIECPIIIEGEGDGYLQSGNTITFKED